MESEPSAYQQTSAATIQSLGLNCVVLAAGKILILVHSLTSQTLHNSIDQLIDDTGLTQVVRHSEGISTHSCKG